MIIQVYFSCFLYIKYKKKNRRKVIKRKNYMIKPKQVLK